MSIVTEPVHLQLARVCREKITRGDFKTEQRFSSERELALEYGVSRATANKVLSQMVAENLLIHKPGIGMFVAPPRSLHASLRQMDSFTDYVRDLGMQPETKVLTFEKVTAAQLPEPVRSGLQMEPSERAYFIERLRLADGEPVILEFRWARATPLPKLEHQDLSGSFYHLLSRKFDVHLSGEEHTIQARTLDAEQATKLQVEVGAPALVVEGPGFGTDDTPLWYQLLIYRGDRYQLENSVRVAPRRSSSVIRLVRENKTTRF